MKQILILGAGMISSSLIKYVSGYARIYKWHVIVADKDLQAVETKLKGFPEVKVLKLDIFDKDKMDEEIPKVDIVVSLLPAYLHKVVAKYCLAYRKHLISTSYLTEEIKEMDMEVKARGVTFLFELGLDPGLDQMIALNNIHQIKRKGGVLSELVTGTGNILYSQKEDNPWHYKFMRNSRNIVMSGHFVSSYIQKGAFKYVPYHRLYENVTYFNLEGLGEMEMYPNRDVYRYKDIYNLSDYCSFYRGVIHKKGFGNAWGILVKLGLTDDSYQLHMSESMTLRDYMRSFLSGDSGEDVENMLCRQFNISKESDELKRIKWLGLMDDANIGMDKVTPAEVLQNILEKKWSVHEEDRDVVVLLHRYYYELNGVNRRKTVTMRYQSESPLHTAMSMTVGLPAAIALKLMLTGEVDLRGVQNPYHQSLYEPILNELEEYNIGVEDQDEIVTE